MKTVVKKEGRAWSWQLKQGREVVAGGYCRTKKDALNDARVADVARAGVGGGVPHERAKHDSTRAKAQNAPHELPPTKTL